MWIFKDFIMFFFVWRAYVPSGGSDPTKMIGKTGTTREVLNPSGYIQIDGELWYAELMDNKLKIDSGIKVIVREAHGLTLFVEILN